MLPFIWCGRFVQRSKFHWFWKVWSFCEKLKNENHEKNIFLKDFGQFGGAHPTPEVKMRLYTKFEVHRRELEHFWKAENLDFLPGGQHPPRTLPPPEGLPRASQGLPRAAEGRDAQNLPPPSPPSPSWGVSVSEEFGVPVEGKGEAVAALHYQKRHAAALGRWIPFEKGKKSFSLNLILIKIN